MMTNFGDSRFDEDLEPIAYPGHDTSRSNCSCDLCKFERFVLVLDRIEAEQIQAEFDRRIQEEQDNSNS